MWKKLLILSLCISVLFVFSAPISSVNAGGTDVEINWRVAGPIINEVMTSGDPPGQTLIMLKAKGAPGPADLTVLGTARLAEPGEEVPGCHLTIIFEQDEFVAVFSDLSMLFAKLMEGGDSYLCGVFPPAPNAGTTFKFDMEITGGTGRFDGATGGFIATGVGHGEYFEGPLSAESGEFKGLVKVIHTGPPHPFNDIGGLSTEFQDAIAALYQSGITTGTSPTTYSPDNPVTRAQVAAFFARALGLYRWP
jgi:S-layer homology domain